VALVNDRGPIPLRAWAILVPLAAASFFGSLLLGGVFFLGLVIGGLGMTGLSVIVYTR
jgi:hypothetical protein